MLLLIHIQLVHFYMMIYQFFVRFFPPKKMKKKIPNKDKDKKTTIYNQIEFNYNNLNMTNVNNHYFLSFTFSLAFDFCFLVGSMALIIHLTVRYDAAAIKPTRRTAMANSRRNDESSIK